MGKHKSKANRFDRFIKLQGVGLDLDQIADVLGVNKRTIYRYAETSRGKKVRRVLPKNTTQKMIALNETHNTVEIANIFGVGQSAVSGRFKRIGYKPKRHPRRAIQ